MEMLITPEIAANWLEKYAYHRQRKINRDTVDAYAAQMAAGQWRMGDGLIIIADIPGNKYLIAGNHRLHAVVKSQTAIWFNVVERHLKGEDDVLAEYASTNAGYKMTVAQSIDVLGTGGVIGVPANYLKAAIPAVRFISQRFDAGKGIPPIMRSTATIDSILRAWQAPIYGYYRNTHGAPNGQQFWYNKAPLMAIGIVTMRYQPEIAAKFWYELSCAEGLMRGTPLFNLHNKLATHKTNSNDARKDLAVYAVRAWNAYYHTEEEGTRLKRLRNDAVSLPINGTPAAVGGEWDALSLLGVK